MNGFNMYLIKHNLKTNINMAVTEAQQISIIACVIYINKYGS